MKFSTYNNFGALNSGPVFAAFAQGLTALGHSVVSHDDNADVAVIWSQLWAGRMSNNQHVWNLYRKSNRPVVVLEVGAIARGKTWKILLNGENKLRAVGNSSQRRTKLGIDLQPWKQNGDYVLVALQRPDSNQWAEQPPVQQWLDQTVDKIKQYTSRPIVVRKHPRYKNIAIPSGCREDAPIHVAGTYDSFNFKESIDQAWAVVNWNSNPGVEATLQGVAAFVGPSSLAAPVANLDLSAIETPIQFDREQWANDLAWTEWSTQEIATGTPVAIQLKQILG